MSVRILLVEIRLRALWNERLGDLLEATANQASTLLEAGFQEIDRLQQIGVLALTGERQVSQQWPQVRLEHGCEVGYELPFEGGDIDGVSADEVRCALDFVAFQDGKCPPLYLAERDRISNLSSRNRSRICPMCWTFLLPSMRSERRRSCRQTLAAESTLRTW